jgi:hypothetical protein
MRLQVELVVDLAEKLARAVPTFYDRQASTLNATSQSELSEPNIAFRF